MAPLGDGMGIFHTVSGFKNQLSVSVTACRDMLPDPDFYAECIREAFDEYKSLLVDDGGEDQTVVYLE
ncbi:MAG: DUF1298 domain-containing protein, partial [Kangiella sp.]|nr:DUF1298 domain-containing protein [Kangiella sp.]